MVKVIDKAKYFEMIGHKPHPKQWLYHNSPNRFRVAVCGRRFGKSMMAGRDLQPRIMMPDFRTWIVGPTYDLGEKEFRVIWNDMMIGLKMGRNRQVKKAYNKRSGEMYIEFPWQTRLEVRSADHPDGLVGEKLNHVIMSEAAKHKVETWERYIRPALTDVRGTADFPTTPEGYNWLYKVWQQGQDPKFTQWASWQFPSWENPYVYPEGKADPELEEIRMTTVEEWFLQEYGAEFSAFVGKIYSEFQETVHVKPLTFHPEWPNYFAFDWGYTNPLAAIEFQVAPDDTIYVWREHYKSGWRLQDHVNFLKSREQPEGYHWDAAFADAADPEAAATINAIFGPCWAEPEAKQNWREGVDLVKGFLRKRVPLGDIAPSAEELIVVTDEIDGPPGMFIDNSCTNTIREFNNYRAKQAQGNLPTNLREAAQVYDDHALDAIRYGLMHIYRLGLPGRLSDTVAPINKDAEGGYSKSENTDGGHFTMAELNNL